MNAAASQFCSRPRYFYEIAVFLQVSKPTLRTWLEDLEGVKYVRGKKLYSQKEVAVIVRELGVSDD